jgi:hypothetical protein
MNVSDDLRLVAAPLFLIVLPLLLVLIRDAIGKNPDSTIALTGLEYLSSTKLRLQPRRRWYRVSLLAVIIVTLGLLWARPEFQTSRPIFYADTQTRQKSIILAIDVSRSMASDRLAGYGKADAAQANQKTRYEAARDTVYSFVDRFPTARIGLILFSTEPFLARWPTTGTSNRFDEILEENLKESSQLRRFSSLTNTDAALMLAKDIFAKHATTQGGAIVYISDAEDEIENMRLAIRNLRDNGIRLYAVGVGISESIASKLAQDFADDPGFRIFRADSEEEMRDAYRLVSELEEAPRILSEESAFVTDLRGIMALALAIFSAVALWLLETRLHRTQVAGTSADGGIWKHRVFRVP